MKLLIVLSSLIIVQAGVIKEDEETCDGVNVDNKYHDKEVLKAELDRPYLLAVDYSNNVVYFSYSITASDDEFKTARLNLETKEFQDIKGVNNGFAQTVDPKTNDVYIGGSDGIYKYNYNTDKAEFYGAKDENIWTLFVKDDIYYSSFPSQFLYVSNNDTFERFKDLEDTKVDNFLIDKEDLIFFTNGTGLYSQKKGSKDAEFYEDSTGIRGITLDVNGNVYVCKSDGIYSVDKTMMYLIKIADLDDAFGVAFDKDNNIIYSDATQLIRLKPNEDKNC
ncbi:ommochrome-binding protein-like [Pectinophora gossypiella]|uniref:ommochrome-binding protein-like n=1 Tax=Pectinophora gossypiella TaxID=13191 RepID=UPI00214EA467|nr:ommochrome-binding protein-like [Pectinophora gossypiella]